MKNFLAVILLFISALPVNAQMGAASRPDPFILDDSFQASQNDRPARSTAGLTVRSQIINPAQKTLVLLCAGQSNISNVVPTRVIPTNTAAIDQFNIYDGASYSTNGALIGASNDDATHGNLAFQVADKFLSGGQFNRVILVGMGVSTTSVAQWATGPLKDRIKVAMLRLASRGITPATAGVTFALWWAQGESDVGTSQASYQAAFQTVLANAVAAGFSGRAFVPKQTRLSGSVNATVQAAQLALVDNVTIWSGGDMDALAGTNRQGDNTHWSDTGAPNAATVVYNAMHASGSPF